MTIRDDYNQLFTVASAVVECYQDGNLGHAIRVMERYLKQSPPDPPATVQEAKDKVLARNFIRQVISASETPGAYARLLGQLGALDRDGFVQLAGLLAELTAARGIDAKVLQEAVKAAVERFDKDEKAP